MTVTANKKALLDESANRMASAIMAVRRELEEIGAIQLCAECDSEAKEGSCYCQSCEDCIDYS